MNAPRLSGLILLATGFLVAAFVSVRDTDARGWQSIDWKWYASAMLAGVAGVVLVRQTATRARADSWKSRAELDSLHQALAELDRRLSAIDLPPHDVYTIHGTIDRDLMPELHRFVAAREALITYFGLQSYADIMTEFAAGERSLNRAWSASADGYIDEVHTSLQRARQHLAEARMKLSALPSSPEISSESP